MPFMIRILTVKMVVFFIILLLTKLKGEFCLKVEALKSDKLLE